MNNRQLSPMLLLATILVKILSSKGWWEMKFSNIWQAVIIYFWSKLPILLIVEEWLIRLWEYALI